MESVYGTEYAQQALPSAESAAPDPAKVEAVASAVNDLAAHVKARAAQHPDIQGDFRELDGVLKSLAKRFEVDALGVSQVGHMTETEARLVDGLVRRVAGGRDHLELSYLRQLADTLTFAVLALAV